MKRIAVLLALLAAVASVRAQNEPFRPQFHFTPERNWMNDPNGVLARRHVALDHGRVAA